jgi:hypothetical protein
VGIPATRSCMTSNMPVNTDVRSLRSLVVAAVADYVYVRSAPSCTARSDPRHCVHSGGHRDE